MNKIAFQTRAQEELVGRALTLLDRPGRSVMTFKAPTGSGKTVMLANALMSLTTACQDKHNPVILWVAPNKLHEQSYARLKRVYEETRALDCVLASELTGSDFPERAVVFTNWGSIDSDTLRLRRDNETGRNLEMFVQRARAVGRKLVLVVDESHLHLDSGEQAQVVVDHIIKPDLLIEVSATPRFERPDAPVVVLREDVTAAGLIRKSVVVNPGATPDAAQRGYSAPTLDATSESLLDAALEKQAELTRKFKEAGSAVVPLVLVQLPDKRSSPDALERFERYLLMNHGLERGKGLAVWLSGDRSPEVDAIAEFGSPVRVMFFKQAVATGWDCPRAQILVGLREMKSDTFTTQVLGRILRQPELKHYEDDSLNRGYVFTNYEELKVDKDVAAWLDKAVVKAKAPLRLELPNWTPKNFDRRGFLTLETVKSILAHNHLLNGSSHMGEVTARLIDGEVITDIDARQAIHGSRVVALDIPALQEKLDAMKAELVSMTASQTKGKKYIEKALRDAAIQIASTDDEKIVLETILHPANRPLFMQMARQGIEDFLSTQAKAARELEMRDSWQAPASRFIDVSAPMAEYTKCLYEPVLEGQFQRSNVEEPFSEYLDACVDVELWLKNGDNGREHFALKYELGDEPRLFYVDFIVRTVSGGIRLYDTKGAGASELSTGNRPDTFAKAKALFEYVRQQRERGIDIDGGIVVRHKGVWLLHRGDDYRGTEKLEATHGWHSLELV